MTTTPPRRVTLRDVAQEAGVHFTVASKVLNGGTATVRDETRARIERVALDLGYRTNALARGLRTASTGSIGMLLPSSRNPVYSELIRGAFERAWARGFVLVYAEDAGESAATQAYERLVAQNRIDGLLIATARPDNPLVLLAESTIVPCIFVNRRHPSGDRSVSMREEDAGALAARHLIELGHTRLGHLAGLRTLDTARRRLAGFRATASGARLRVAVEHARFDEPDGFAAMGRLLDRRARPTAVFVSNLNQAIGAMAAARRAGIAIPQQLSIVAYDADRLGEFLDPPLTAVRMPLQELGATAVDVLLARIERGRGESVVVSTEPELVARGSTAPVPGG